jgi:hypothetical protein
LTSLEQLAPVLQRWLMGYRLPPADDPLAEVEAADLQILRLFFSLLLVSAPSPPFDPISAVRAHLPDFPSFPLFGLPSEALIVSGIARPSGPAVELQQRLLEGLSADQAATMLVLAGEA